MIGAGEGQAGSALSIWRESVVQPRQPVLQRVYGRALMVVALEGASDERRGRAGFVIGGGGLCRSCTGSHLPKGVAIATVCW